MSNVIQFPAAQSGSAAFAHQAVLYQPSCQFAAMPAWVVREPALNAALTDLEKKGWTVKLGESCSITLTNPTIGIHNPITILSAQLMQIAVEKGVS